MREKQVREQVTEQTLHQVKYQLGRQVKNQDRGLIWRQIFNLIRQQTRWRVRALVWDQFESDLECKAIQ